jgi:hypothetical protein
MTLHRCGWGRLLPTRAPEAPPANPPWEGVVAQLP